jgi:transmembrane sensor
MGETQEIDIKHLLKQMLSNELTVSEKEKLQRYIQQTYKDHELDRLMHDHWLELENKLVGEDEAQFVNLKNRIISLIATTNVPLNKEYTLSPSNWRYFLMRVAAVLFVPLLLSSILVFYSLNKRIDTINGEVSMQEIVASPGSRVHFTLPDRTEVWLNSKSKLEFPVNLNQQKQRRVKLTGQGYFKVAHDKQHPFFVDIEGISIEALGTAFDVSGYNDDMQIKSTLEEGAIAFLGENGKEVAHLIPGQQAIMDKTTQSVVVENVKTALTTSWKDGKLIFRNSSITEVAKQLERWFNCEIHLDPKLQTSNLFYTATLQDETLGEVLKMIEISTSVKTTIKKREVFIENTK